MNFKITRFFYPALFLLCILMPVRAKSLLGDKKAARINNQIILVTDVEEHAKKFNISYNEALDQLIDEAVLFFGAKVTTFEPTEEEIEKKIREDRNYFAAKIGKRVSQVTDEDFLVFIINNYGSKKNYVDKIKRDIWILTFLEDTFLDEKVKISHFSNTEIETFIRENPELFEEKDGARISMIYFSYYTSEGKPRSRASIEKQKEKAETCLYELTGGQDFREMVKKYSNDIISLEARPTGYVGTLYFDDPRTYEYLSREIVEELKKIEQPGLLEKTFVTRNGIYIFYIDEKLDPKKINEDKARMKAADILKIRKERELKEEIRNRVIKDLKKKADIVIY